MTNPLDVDSRYDFPTREPDELDQQMARDVEAVRRAEAANPPTYFLAMRGGRLTMCPSTDTDD